MESAPEMVPIAEPSTPNTHSPTTAALDVVSHTASECSLNDSSDYEISSKK